MTFERGRSDLKIDGVQTVDEALALERAGATVIGIDPTPRAASPGPVSRRIGLEIREALTRCTLAVRLDEAAGSVEAALAAAQVFNPDMVQITRHALGWTSWRAALGDEGLPVFVDALSVSYEDDTAFVESRMRGLGDWPMAIAQVQFLGDIANPWPFLLNEAPSEPDGYVQLEDLRALTQKYPMVVSMGLEPGEALAFYRAFPDAKGLCFDIADEDLDSVLALIQAAQS
jgi:hypothetical protein